MSYEDSIRTHPYYQYTYCRSPLYCLMDRETLDLSGWSFWDVMDGDISAPECLPTGGRNGSNKHGSCVYKDFVWRLHGTEEHQRREAVAKLLIDEMLKELAEEAE